MKNRLAYVADTPDWCISRDGQGLVSHGETADGAWRLFHTTEGMEALEDADFALFGSLPIFYECLLAGALLPKGLNAVTFASFRDSALAVLMPDGAITVDLPLEHLSAIVINDRRMYPAAVKHGLPVIYHPDRVDMQIFQPKWHRRPKSGPLRIGWAGSASAWGNVKHLDALERVAPEHAGAIEFVRQDASRDPLKGQHEMIKWYNGLDAYICLNDELTPTPVGVLEAMACAIPIITTKCGEAYPYVYEAGGIVAHQAPLNPDETAGNLFACAWALGRAALQDIGELTWQACGAHLSWQGTRDAVKLTDTIVALTC